MANLLPGTPVIGETFSPGGRTVNGILLTSTANRHGTLVSVVDGQYGHRAMHLVDIRVDEPASAKLAASLLSAPLRRERDCEACEGSGSISYTPDEDITGDTSCVCDCEACHGTGLVVS